MSQRTTISPEAERVNRLTNEYEKNPTSDNKKSLEKAQKILSERINQETNAKIPAEETKESFEPKTAICCECRKVVDINNTKQRGDYFICNDCSNTSKVEDKAVTSEPEPKVIESEPAENYLLFDVNEKDEAIKTATERGWKIALLLDVFFVSINDTYVVYENTDKMTETMAKIVNKLELFGMVPAITSTQAPATSETGKKNKTQGIYEITSNFNPNFSLKGSSSQIEICTRDYMSWCLKDKAPKSMQAEYDRAKKENKESDPKKIFKVNILKVAQSVDNLKAAKEEFGISNKGGKPRETNSDKSKNITPEEALKNMPTFATTHGKTEEKTEAPDTEGNSESIVEMSDGEMYDLYKEGMDVGEICKMNDITQSEFYKKMEQFK